MIEAKLLVDRYLKFTRPTWRNLTGAAPVFANVLCAPLTIRETDRRNKGAKLNPFRSVGGDRMSSVVRRDECRREQGPPESKIPALVSGRYLGDRARSRCSDRAHVGMRSGLLPAGGQPHGRAHRHRDRYGCRACHNQYERQESLERIRECPRGRCGRRFQPGRQYGPDAPPAAAGDIGGETWGLYSTTGQFYAVQVYLQKDTVDEYRVSAFTRYRR